MAANDAVASLRRRRARQGLIRLEVTVGRDDARLLREVARALCDPGRGPATRAVLRGQIEPPSRVDLKALLAAAPLGGIDLGRAADPGRDVEL